MARPLRPRQHRSSLEGVIVPPSQPLKPQERELANRSFDEIIQHFESSQATDSGYKPITVVSLMKAEVSEKEEFLNLFFSFIQQDLFDQGDKAVDLDQILLHLANISTWSSEERNALDGSLVAFAKYLVDNFFLPLKTPQPTPALSHSRTPETAIGTPQRVSNLRRNCLVRDRHRCVVTRKFDAQEAQDRYRRDRHNVKDDDGKSLLPERDTMAYLEVAHIIPHSLMSLTSGESEWRLQDSKQIPHRILKMFNPGAIHLINGVDIDRPMNALTLTHDLHKLFGNFEIVFEPVGSQPHTYRIDYVESDRMGRVEKLPVTVTFYLTPDRSVDPPSPQLLRIHSAIGRILHLSAAGDYIDKFLRDMEELNSGQVTADGSTCLDDYVWFRLGEMPVH